MAIENVTCDLGGGRLLTIETGKLALLAGGSVTVQQGDTIVLVAACSAAPRPGLDFFPLQVDYRERFSAAGRMPGGYFKREGRPSEKEICTARMTDRPLRPLFPEGYIDDVQIMASLLSADTENEADVLSMVGASAALVLSDIPFAGPIGMIRVGRVDGTFIANPTHSEMANSDIDLIYAGLEGKTIMIEGQADEISEEVLRDALTFADSIVRKLIALQRELAERAGKPKQEPSLTLVPEDVVEAARAYCSGKIEQACFIPGKAERGAALKALCSEMAEALTPQFQTEDSSQTPNFRGAFEKVTEETVRSQALEQGRRMDGRGPEELRQITCEVGLLPRTHGSALFSRGDTQALATLTLAAESEGQSCDAITGGENNKRFMLHYNFPNYSVGETGRIMGPGRREIGHGALAERSLVGMIPKDYPYALRCVSDILGSNGSSSMASVCAGSLVMMDAGVPIERAVAGISVGLVSSDDGRKVFLTDILGKEDHYGDMDFKVAGTSKGITAFQLDLKIAGLDIDSMYDAMLLNKKARTQILETMNACIAQPREEMSKYAPKVFAMKINPDKIGALIGPGGKVIRGITDMTGAQIDVEDDGTVKVFAINDEMLQITKREIEAVTAEPEIGRIYQGTVRTVKDFGAFVEVLPGQDGLLHISELADYRVNRVEEICNVGDTVAVKIIDIDERGRIRLSRREALAELD